MAEGDRPYSERPAARPATPPAPGTTANSPKPTAGQPGPVTPRTPIAGPKGKFGCGTGCLIIVVLGVVIGGIAGIVSATSGPDQSSDAALAACQIQVQKELKSPDSAKFSNDSETGKAPDWTVDGTVSSQNSFGVQLSATYECSVHFSGGDAEVSVDSVNEN